MGDIHVDYRECHHNYDWLYILIDEAGEYLIYIPDYVSISTDAFEYIIDNCNNFKFNKTYLTNNVNNM